jgi:predicted ATPase/DNA-binding winged helix-turn-helix (wHTH) protein
VYGAGSWEIDTSRRELRLGGVPVPVGSRAFDVIEALVTSSGELVTKDVLMERVWPGAIVEENTLQVHISAIRKAFGAHREMLKTVPGRGYRLLGEWALRRDSMSAEPEAPAWAPVPPRPFQTNIPVAASALFGREATVQQVRNLLSAYRAVTLTGPGGIGKTVLASEVARRLFPSIQSDVFFVELASLSDPDLLPPALANVLDLRLGVGEMSPASVARAIGDKKVLLVLDNCEHVIDAAASLTETLLRLCPRTTVLATSREVLRIEGEFVYLVNPLDVPSSRQDAAGDVLEHSAVQLFITRTKSLRKDFAAHQETLAMIGAICRRLDGIPLAIEFAAARAATLGVRQVAHLLDDRFALLTAGRRTALPRHQTLRATLDWSYELLPETERCLLRRLALFPAGFTLDAATAVMSDTGSTATVIMDGISNLVSKSLVTLDEPSPIDRWRLLETIRAYALEKLGDSDERTRAGRAHAVFFRDLVMSSAPVSRSDPTLSGLSLCLREIDNVRAALDWAFSAAGEASIGVALTAAFVPIWLHSALLVECRERTDRALDSLDADTRLSERLRLQLHMGVGVMAVFTLPPLERTRKFLETALEIAESLNDADGRLSALRGLWMLHYYSGESRAALSLAEQMSAVASSVGEPFSIILADRLIGNALHQTGDQRRAQGYLERVLERSVTPTTRRNSFYPQVDNRVYAQAYMARVLLLRGYLDQAAERARMSLEEAVATGYQHSICQALRIALCPVALITGDLAAAGRDIAKLVDAANSFNAPFWKSAARAFQARLLIEQGAFEAGSALLRSEIEACERTGWSNWYPEYQGSLAKGLAGLGRLSDALASIDRGLEWADRGGERCYVAELLRLKAEFLLAELDGERAADIDDCFSAALKLAREQGALLFELRASMGLARWRMRQDRPEDARQILAPVYGRFVEGFDAVDLRAASTLLATLDVPAR